MLLLSCGTKYEKSLNISEGMGGWFVNETEYFFQINVYIYYTAQSKHSYNIPSIVGVHFEYKTAAKLMTKQLLYTK